LNLNFELRGVAEINRILEQVTPKHARAIMRNTNYAIAAEVRNDIRQRVRVSSGDLKRSIAIRNMRGNPDQPTSIVYFKEDGYYWRFVEKGTKAGKKGSRTVTSGRNRKQYRTHPGNRPQPFVEPAVEAMRQKLPEIAQQKFVKVLEKTIARELKRQAK
jgi:HK97 gp10 family phage protein